MINFYLIIFFVIILTILVIIFLNYLLKEKKLNSKIVYPIENFSNSIIVPNILPQEDTYNKINLIKNGDFKNGKNCLNQVNQNGYNKIIIMKNPGYSSYVLEQKKTDNLTYYEIVCDNDKNCKYNFYFWLCIENSSIEELDFEKLIKIKFQNEDFSNYIPRLF